MSNKKKKVSKKKPKVDPYIQEVSALKAYIRECIDTTYTLGTVNRSALVHNSNILSHLQSAHIACDKAIEDAKRVSGKKHSDDYEIVISDATNDDEFFSKEMNRKDVWGWNK